MSYYERKPALHLDGTRIFQCEEDRKTERAVAETISRKWSCSITAFGSLSPIDWFATRDGRIVGVLELKARSHAHDAHPTTFLTVRKWLALTLASCGLAVPAIFVVRFTDGVYWTPLSKVDATQARIAGGVRVVKGANDIEPMIEVSSLLMQQI